MPNIKQIKTPNNTTYDILDANAYHVNDTEETNKDNLNNDDFIPFYETSGTAAPKKMKVSNLINRLKTLLGLGTASTRAYTTSVTQNSDDLVTSGAVWTAIDELPEPMVFRGSLGTGGTITSLPTNGTAAIGDTYKVITKATYAGISAEVGDTFICVTKTSSANTWTLIPSGDEPSGTVTSVKIEAASPIAVDNTSAITNSGTRTISHETSGATAGSYGDSGNQTPAYGGTFKVPYITVNDTGHVTGISAHTVKIPASDNTNTTYTFANGTNKFTVTPSSGSATDVSVTPQIKIDGITSDNTEINCYGECSTDAGTAAKTVSITKGTFALGAGSKVIVKFTNANTANNPTLNVNSKGAKNIFHNGARITTGTNKAMLAGVIELVYDGTQFHLVGNYVDTNTTYTAGTGLSLDGTTINHSNSVTAGTAKGDNSKTLTFGGTFTVPSVTYDAQGHITAKGTTTMTMPTNPNTDTLVTQTDDTSSTTALPLLIANSTTTPDTATTRKNANLTFKPSTQELTIKNDKAYSTYPMIVDMSGRSASTTAGQDIKVLQVKYKTHWVTTTDGVTTEGDVIRTTYPISVIGSNSDSAGNNNGVRLGSVNGTTIVGAGESSATYATAQSHFNDENLYLTADGNVVSEVGLANNSTTSKTKCVLGDNYIQLQNTTDTKKGTTKSTYFHVGNNISKDAEQTQVDNVWYNKNSAGVLRLYGRKTFYGQFFDNDYLTDNRNYYLPDKSGTLALTSDVPTVNNKTIKIQQNGTDVDSFTLNQNTDKTINVTDRKVYRNKLTNSDTTWRRLLLTDGSSENGLIESYAFTGIHYKASDAALSLNSADGTAGTTKYNDIRLGNGTDKASAGNSAGRIRFYSPGTKYIDFKTADSITDHRTIKLPDIDGDVAVIDENGDLYTTNLAATENVYAYESVQIGARGASGELIISNPHSDVTLTAPTSDVGSLALSLPESSGTIALTSQLNKANQSDASSTGWRNLALVRNNKTSYNESVYKNMGLSMQVETVGVKDTEGIVNLAIGNSKAKTVADNYTGRLFMYNGNGAKDIIQTNSSQTSNITLTLPNATGTFQLQDKISYNEIVTGTSTTSRTVSADSLNPAIAAIAFNKMTWNYLASSSSTPGVLNVPASSPGVYNEYKINVILNNGYTVTFLFTPQDVSSTKQLRSGWYASSSDNCSIVVKSSAVTNYSKFEVTSCKVNGSNYSTYSFECYYR